MVNFTNYGYPIEIHSTWGTYEIAFLIVTLLLVIVTGFMVWFIHKQIKQQGKQIEQQGKEIQQNIKIQTLDYIKKISDFTTDSNHFGLYNKLLNDYDQKKPADYSDEEAHVLEILAEMQKFFTDVHFIPLNIELLNQTIGPNLKRVIHNPGVDSIIKKIQEKDERYFNIFNLVDKDLRY